MHPKAPGSALGYPADIAEIEFDHTGRARQVLLTSTQNVTNTFRAEDVHQLTASPEGANFKVVARHTDGSTETFDATAVTFAHNVPNAQGRRSHFVLVWCGREARKLYSFEEDVPPQGGR